MTQPPVPLLIVLLSCLAAPLLAVDLHHGNVDVNFQLVRHDGCKTVTGKWKPKITLEGGNSRRGPQLRPIRGQSNCYEIGGQITVHEDIAGDFSIYMEVRTDPRLDEPPFQCHSQGTNGCGGVGSCLYCNACEQAVKSEDVKARLLRDGRPISCREGLRKGHYTDMKLTFCFPSLKMLAESQNMSEDELIDLVRSDDGTPGTRELPLYARIYLFERDVSKEMQSSMRAAHAFDVKNDETLFKGGQLRPDIYWSLPFNEMIRQERGFVGCHAINGNVQITEK